MVCMCVWTLSCHALSNVDELLLGVIHRHCPEQIQMSGETSSIDFNVAEQFKALLTGMGTALITTFYGVFLANMVFLPIAGKLKRRSENELMLKNIVLEGIISIHGREHPILIREKLMTFVALSERASLEKKEE